jgi:hypothetical protein
MDELQQLLQDEINFWNGGKHLNTNSPKQIGMIVFLVELVFNDRWILPFFYFDSKILLTFLLLFFFSNWNFLNDLLSALALFGDSTRSTDKMSLRNVATGLESNHMKNSQQLAQLILLRRNMNYLNLPDNKDTSKKYSCLSSVNMTVENSLPLDLSTSNFFPNNSSRVFDTTTTATTTMSPNAETMMTDNFNLRRHNNNNVTQFLRNSLSSSLRQMNQNDDNNTFWSIEKFRQLLQDEINLLNGGKHVDTHNQQQVGMF